MSEEIENNNNNNDVEQVDYKALYEQAQQDIQSLAAKKDEILTEAKKAKAARANLEAQQKEAMQQNGEFENLWKAEQERAASVEKQLNEFKSQIRNEKLTNNAMKIANELAKGRAESAELLSSFVGQSLAEHANDLGDVSDSVLETIKYQFQNDKKYAPLLGGSKATGGGAVGGKASGNSSSEMARQDFDNMNPGDKMKFIQSGGKIVE